MTVAIIGLGLMGGSAAIDLKNAKFADRIIGCDKNKDHETTALSNGIADEIADLETAVKKSRLVIVAIPLDAAIKLIPKVLDLIDDQIVTDMSSAKSKIAETVKHHKKRRQFVSAHPMAGTEFSGPLAAHAGMFNEKAAIICDAEESSPEALELTESMYKSLNMRIIHMDSRKHDVHAAYVSHISHISSFALALTVLEKEENEKNIFDLASGGFSSTVRLAKSSADMWVPIFIQNKENVSQVLETYIKKLQDFKNQIDTENTQGLHESIRQSNRIKRVLNPFKIRQFTTKIQAKLSKIL
jgi:prephenate dehydrogenase